VFQQIVAAGHRVGNHTFHHIKGWQTPDVQYLEEVRQCDAEMAKHEVATELFRPPYGRIKRSQIRALGSRKIVMWDVLTNDYDRSLSEEDCLAGTLSATRSGSIVVFHDSLKAERNLRYVLPRYLEYLAAGGYQFKTL
jgi:peptidoglycan/xylan/chitin deacetylase (PgdA/CDA1 family)